VKVTSDTVPDEVTVRSVRAIGTTATVLVQHPDGANEAERIMIRDLAAIDLACSRFRPDSELHEVQAQAGRPVRVSTLLFNALETAVSVAERTHGAVDPTVGNAIAQLGYDRDLSEVLFRPRPPAPPTALGPVAGYQHIHLDQRRRTVRVPRGVALDLGSTAKAFVADRIARHVVTAIGSGVLVSVGGDISVAGEPPQGGWAVGIAEASDADPDAIEQTVAIRHGGLASSSQSVRTWTAGSRSVHHIIDPRTGDCAEAYWTLVSATGTSCVAANAVTTAALVWGADAISNLSSWGQAVRLVRRDGRIFSLNGWPEERAA
jgi:thiamine biosynthesis lipoprotein